jgi:PAS domain S-box-containing protein
MMTLNRCLQDKQVLLESLFDTIQDGIIVLDQNFTIVQINRWMEEKFASKMPLVGEKCHSVFYKSQVPCSDCHYIASLEKGRSLVQEISYPSDRNPMEWFELSMSRLEDAQGKVIGAVGHVKDITVRKKAKEFLKDEVIRRRILVDQSRDGIVVVDENGKVFESNQQFARMLGYTMEEVHQLHVWDWDMQWSNEQLLEMIQAVDHSGDHFVTSHRCKDGTTYDVEISSNGAVYRGQKLVFCVCRDISERKRAEKEREKLIANLQEALNEIKTLRSILPLCSYCKKIRDDKGCWEQVDVYIQKHLQADITHGICPECLKKNYPGEYEILFPEKA